MRMALPSMIVWGGSTIAQLGVAGRHITSHDRVVSVIILLLPPKQFRKIEKAKKAASALEKYVSRVGNQKAES